MSESTYWVLLLIVDGVILFFGLHLIFGAISKELKKSRYHAARIFAGSAFTVSPITGFLFYALDFNSNAATYYATAVNLTAYYATAILFAFAFISIIGRNYNQVKRVVIITIISFIIYLIPTWLPILFGIESLIKIGHIISNIMLFFFIISIGTNIYIIYNRTLKNFNNYYSEDLVSYIKWIGNSCHLFAGLGIIACISPFSRSYSTIVCLFYLAYEIFVFFYIYESFQRFEFKYLLSFFKEEEIAEQEKNKIEQIKQVSPTKYLTISNQTTLHIEKELNIWIKQGGFRTQGITVKSVASEIYTNRTYLSNYINSTYKCTFKEWITAIRIDESKKLLYDYEEYSNSEIAQKVGFSSENLFVNTFQKMEGVTPIKWKENNKRFIGK